MAAAPWRCQCPNCLKVLRVNDAILGNRVRCPGCQSVILLPTADELRAIGQPPAPISDASEELDAVALVEDNPFRDGWSLRKLLNGPDGTNVNFGVSAVIALGITAVFFVVVVWPLAFAGTKFGQLFGERGWVQYASTFLAVWAGVILALKTHLLRRQRQSLRLPVLPHSPDKITPQNVETFLSNVRELARTSGTSFLLRRVWRALEHFRVTGNRQDVAAQLDTQAQVDATTAAGSYTLVKVCMGAIPILGFIGTCMGIAAAVGHFSTALEGSASIETLKGSLGSVTTNLGVAFDTTLLALGLSVVILFASSSLEKREEAVLNAIEEYCSEKLLRRLQDSPAGVVTDKAPTSFEAAVQQALVPYQAELRVWIDKFNGVADALSKRVTEGWQAVAKQAQEAAVQQVQQLRSMQDSQTRELTGIARGMSEAAAKVHIDLNSLQAQQINHAKDVAGVLHSDLRAVEQQGREVQKMLSSDWKQLMDQVAGSLRTLQTETVQAQGEIRENLRNVCAALRTLITKLDESRPLLADINTTLDKARVIVDASALVENGHDDSDSLAKTRRRWWLLGARR